MARRSILLVFSLVLALVVGVQPVQSRVNTLYYPPVLMYHHVEANQKSRYFISPALFEDELAYLAKNGFRSITMHEYATALRSNTELPPKSIVLTFDDGYRNAYTTAFPLLKKYGMIGTFYIITGNVGDPAYVTWPELEEMNAAGMEIGAHTQTHAFLTRLSAWKAFYEIWGSRLILAKHLRTPITTFAYPYNDHNPQVVALAQLAGFDNAVIVDFHKDDLPINAYRIPRLTIVNRESMDGFVQVVNKGYPVRFTIDSAKR